MKKHLSVFMLQLTAPLNKILLILFLMSIGQLLIPFACSMGFLDSISFFVSKNGIINIRNIFRTEYILFYIPLMLCFEALRESLSKNNSFDYTIQRLRVSEQAFYWWSVLANVLYMLMIWACEACTLFVVMKILSASNAAAATDLSYYIMSTEYVLVATIIPMKNKLLKCLDILIVFICSVIDCSRARSSRQNLLSENGGRS